MCLTHYHCLNFKNVELAEVVGEKSLVVTHSKNNKERKLGLAEIRIFFHEIL